MILLTTPDYIPQFGGLTTLTLNIEKVIKSLNIEYELFHWKSYSDIVSYPTEKLEKFDCILNIHSGFHQYMKNTNHPVINFVHGSEILFYSPNILKKIFKFLSKSRCLNRLESAKFNIFVSDFTFQKLISKGLNPDYSRDLVCHNMIDTSAHQYLSKDFNSEVLKFVCVARDVPHKNIRGTIKFCEDFQKIAGRKVELSLITNHQFQSEQIKVISIINSTNEKRDQALRESHFNLLLSLDHSHLGFYEGFGQTVQEAACFATPSIVLESGGLPESVHHLETGWVLPTLEKNQIEKWWQGMSTESFDEISKKCYEHTLEFHGLHNWKKLLEKLLINESTK